MKNYIPNLLLDVLRSRNLLQKYEYRNKLHKFIDQQIDQPKSDVEKSQCHHMCVWPIYAFIDSIIMFTKLKNKLQQL